MAPIISQSRLPLNFFPVAGTSPCRSPSGRLRDLLRVSCRKMSSEPPSPFPTVRTVTIPYPELKDKNRDLSRKIERGLGPDGLGIISISNVPGYSLLRQNLLQLSPRLASLPEDAKEEIQDPDSRYNIGWSHGKEKLESGKPDIFKGSFYANPVLDIPTADVGLIERYPSYCRPNKWPTTMPDLEVGIIFRTKVNKLQTIKCQILKWLILWRKDQAGQRLRRTSLHSKLARGNKTFGREPPLLA